MIPYLIMFIHFTETVANNKTPHWTVFNQQDQKLNIYHLISFMRFKWIRWNVTWINGVSIFVYFLKLKSGNLFSPGVGCFHQHHLLYAFPLIPSIMFHRVRQSELRVLLVAPKCPSTVWFPTPCRVLNRDLWQLKRRMDLSCRNIGMAFISRFFPALQMHLKGICHSWLTSSP